MVVILNANNERTGFALSKGMTFVNHPTLNCLCDDEK